MKWEESFGMKHASEVWILLRGLARESRHWGTFPSEFMKSAAGRKVICIDLPGAGEAINAQSPVNVRAMTEFVREKVLSIKKENPGATFYLMAQSLGGMVALDWVARHQDFSGLVLVNTSVSGISPAHHRLRPTAALKLLRIVRERNSVKRELNILKLISNKVDLHGVISKEWAEIADSRPVTIKNFVSQLLAAATFRSPKDKPVIPVLVLSSKADQMVSYRCSEALAKKWSLPLMLHETAGHDLVIDDPAWVQTSVNTWIATREN